MKGLFIPDITAEMFRNGCLEGIEALMAEGEIYDIEYSPWIPVSERLPEEREWFGTKSFGTTKSDTILMTFDVDGTRFVKPLSLQNGKLSRADAQTMDAIHKGWKMVAWMPLPEPYEGGDDKYVD